MIIGVASVETGNRAGALGLFLTTLGIAMLVIGKSPFPVLLAAGFGSSAVAVIASCAAWRWGRKSSGLIFFNIVIFLIVTLAMIASRLNVGHIAGRWAI